MSGIHDIPRNTLDIKCNKLIEEAFVCGSFFLVLKLTNNRKEIVKSSKRILYHTVSRRDQRNGVVKNSF
jgi:hypothetical protein